MRNTTRALLCLLPVLLLAPSAARPDDAATAARNFRVYGSTPKGVTLEGTAVGMEEIETVGYNARNNAFLVNGAVVYRNPIEAEAFAELLRALRMDPRIGVSMTNLGNTIVYGALDPESSLVADLVHTDEFLSGVTFGRREMIGNVRLPEGYQPRRVPVEKAPVATASSYGFLQYYFRKTDDGMHYRRAGFELEIQLVPLRSDYAPDGGHLPDLELMDSGEEYLTPEAKANLGHLKGHRNEYLRMEMVQRSADIGEAAAFARTLIESGVDLGPILARLDAAAAGEPLPESLEEKTPAETTASVEAEATEEDGAPAGEEPAASEADASGGAGLVPAGQGEGEKDGEKRKGLFERIF